MHFSATYRTNPETGQQEPYYLLKETYRDIAGIVRSRIVLSVGFINGLSGEQIRRVSVGLTDRMEHKNEYELFDDPFNQYEPVVNEKINKIWSILVSQGKIDIDHKKDAQRIARERNLLIGTTLESCEAREMGAEWCCYQAVEQLQLSPFLPKQGWQNNDIRKALAVCELFDLSPSVFNKHNIYDIFR